MKTGIKQIHTHTHSWKMRGIEVPLQLLKSPGEELGQRDFIPRAANSLNCGLKTYGSEDKQHICYGFSLSHLPTKREEK